MSLSQLPPHLLEQVLWPLSYRDVSRLRAVNTFFYGCCAAVLRRGFDHLHKELLSEMLLVRTQLAALGPDAVTAEATPSRDEQEARLVQQRAPLLRAYNLMELLLCELRLVRAVAARPQQLRERCFPGGHLLDSFHELLQQAKNRSLPVWSIESDVTGRLLNQIKKYMDNYRRSPFHQNPPLGVLCCDLLDALLDVDACIAATFDATDRSCHLVADYRLTAAQFLCPPPPPPSVGDALTSRQAQALADYLTCVVRFSNRIALRHEQYCRELDVALVERGILDSSRRGRLWTPPREHPQKRSCVLTAATQRMQHSDTPRAVHASCRQHGPSLSPGGAAGALSCRLQLCCPLSVAPTQLWVDAGTTMRAINSRDAAEPLEEDCEVDWQWATPYSATLELRVLLTTRADTADAFSVLYRDGELLPETDTPCHPQ